jgi:hypothetical protein
MNGDLYNGEYSDGERDGYGVYLWEDGSMYSGEFVNEHKHGYGVYKWKNGPTYEGDFRNGTFNGEGTIKWEIGWWQFATIQFPITWSDCCRYSGIWKNGKPVWSLNGIWLRLKYLYHKIFHK